MSFSVEELEKALSLRVRPSFRGSGNGIQYAFRLLCRLICCVVEQRVQQSIHTKARQTQANARAHGSLYGDATQTQRRICVHTHARRAGCRDTKG